MTNIGKFYSTSEKARVEFDLYLIHNPITVREYSAKDMTITLFDDTRIYFVGLRDERDWNRIAGSEFCYAECYDLDDRTQRYVACRIRRTWYD